MTGSTGFQPVKTPGNAGGSPAIKKSVMEHRRLAGKKVKGGDNENIGAQATRLQKLVTKIKLCVAQSGESSRLGSGGRRFKSCHTD